MIRHYVFTVSRLFGAQRHPYLDIDTADWPSVTVLVPAHNEQAVIANALEALLHVKYPLERLEIIPVNDRSTDRTREIIDSYASQYPDRIKPFHRTGGKPGKAAALKEVMARLKSDVIVLFDADYIPAPDLIQRLVTPLFDPEIGAVMGRVVPLNVSTNLLTRLLDLERSGGYQVDQQARMNMNLVPQHGGTVGSVRMSALNDCGGWNDDALAEDTDLTFRLLLKGWKVAYQNRAECYEEVPETWNVRIKQLIRWAWGHNQVMLRYFWPVLTKSGLRLSERLDAILLLAVYALAPMTLLGWILALLAFYLGSGMMSGTVGLLALSCYAAVGNAAAFFELASAVRLDGSRERVRLLPLNTLGFAVSVVCVLRAIWRHIKAHVQSSELVWDKTERFRKAA